MTTTVAECPACGSTQLRPHCGKDHKSCTWQVCRQCASFGVPDVRWYNSETKRAS